MKKLLFLTVLAVFAVSAFCNDFKSFEGKPHRPAPRRKFAPPNRFHKSHGMWMAFAELSAEERQAMLKLQREDPEKFRSEMHKLGEEFFKAEKLRRKELAELVEQYKKADEKDKAAILENIRKRVSDNFKRRLRQSRIQLNELQQRAEELEKELNRREKAEEKIVDAVVNSIVSGRRPPFAPKKRPAPLQAE